MATYYKYAERDASNQVNWSEITSNMVNSLKEVQTIRESKRKAINDATTELSTTLSDAPQGDHRGLNEFAMTYANNAQEMRLMQDKLLKSGQLKLRDYNIGRANLTQGTTQLFNLGKKYQSIYSDRMEKFKSGATGELDAAMLSRLEGFANFSNHEAYINPTNGQVSMGKLIDRTVGGKTVRTMDRTPGSFTTIQQLNFSLSQEIPKYQLDNLDAEVAKFADTYLTTNGAYSSLDDVREMPEFDQIVNDMVSSQLVVENSVGSILASYVGGYEIVFNKEEQNENSILMIEDPRQPGSGKMIMDVESEMGKKQKAKAEEFLKRHIDKQLGSKQTERALPKPTAGEITRKEKINREDYQVSNVAKLMTGNETQVQTAIDYFRDLNDATKKVIRTPNGIEVTFEKDGKLETRDIGFYVGEGENKKTKTVAQFIESASNLLTGKSESGIKNILKRGNYDKDATFNDKLTEDYIADVDVSEDVDEVQDMEVLDIKLNEKLKDLDFYGEDETMQTAIIDKFKDDFALSITPINNDEFIIDVAGYEGSVTIEGDFMGISKVEGEKERRKLKAFMRSLYIQKDKKNKSTTNTSTNTGVKPNMG
tara:strand:- start:1687 stop:3471 length:1785 start_codon:yes stop_codon:yes gene_type:complete